MDGSCESWVKIPAELRAGHEALLMSILQRKQAMPRHGNLRHCRHTFLELIEIGHTNIEADGMRRSTVYTEQRTEAAETDMSELYSDAHRAFQDLHDTRRLADRLEGLAHGELDPNDRAFIESASFFFLSTVDEKGRPTVSYKGGPPGFVRIVGPATLVFPAYDGNGMFLSLGNIASTAQIGLLFINFEPARRLRIQGTAKVIPNEGPCHCPGAAHLVHIAVEQAFVNCGRYIHNFATGSLSPHIPDEAGHQPFPAWKRIDVLADALPHRDKSKLEAAGGPIALEDYSGEGLPNRGNR